MRSCAGLVPALLLAGLLAVPAGTGMAATSPGEMLANPALEARARTLGRELRCLVCQNQSIDDSDADLAADLRRLVRERIVAGDSDVAIKQHLVERYGAFVLLRPPLTAATLALWLGPAVVLLLGAGLIVATFRRAGQPTGAEAAPLSADEQRRLVGLLGEVTGPKQPGR